MLTLLSSLLFLIYHLMNVHTGRFHVFAADKNITFKEFVVAVEGVMAKREKHDSEEEEMNETKAGVRTQMRLSGMSSTSPGSSLDAAS